MQYSPSAIYGMRCAKCSIQYQYVKCEMCTCVLDQLLDSNKPLTGASDSMECVKLLSLGFPRDVMKELFDISTLFPSLSYTSSS